MHDQLPDRTTTVNRGLLLSLFFVTLALGALVLVTVVGLFVEAVAETNELKCGGASSSASYDVAATGKTLDDVSRAVLAGLSQADGSASCAGNPGQRPVMRGGRSQNHLVLVVNYAPGDDRACERHVFVSTGEATSHELQGEWVTGQSGEGLLLTSFEDMNQRTYSYSTELKACGDLIIYGLSFAPDFDVPGEQEESTISALAALLKEDGRLKVRIVGHRASSGDAENDYALSVSDAKAVKRLLVDKYGIGPKRMFAEGMGSEEPIADNGTETGRAANSRIEVVSERSCQRVKEPVIAGHSDPQSSVAQLISHNAGM